jgi:hypothetical protein
LADAVIAAVLEQYGADGEPAGDALMLITTAPGLRAEFIDTVAAIEHPLASAIADRTGSDDDLAVSVLAAVVSAAARVAVERWVRPASQFLVVPHGLLADHLRAALAHVAPALRAADPRYR